MTCASGYSRSLPCLRASVKKHPAERAWSPGNYFDCTPFNCFWQQGTLVPFDLEWETNESRLPLSLVAFRGLYMGLQAISSMAQRTRTYRKVWSPWLQRC